MRSFPVLMGLCVQTTQCSEHTRIRHGRATQRSSLFHIRAKSQKGDKAIGKTDPLFTAEMPLSNWITTRFHLAIFDPICLSKMRAGISPATSWNCIQRTSEIPSSAQTNWQCSLQQLRLCSAEGRFRAWLRWWRWLWMRTKLRAAWH